MGHANFVQFNGFVELRGKVTQKQRADWFIWTIAQDLYTQVGDTKIIHSCGTKKGTKQNRDRKQNNLVMSKVISKLNMKWQNWNQAYLT